MEDLAASTDGSGRVSEREAPGSLSALLRRGSDLLKAKKPDRARAVLEKAYALEPTDAKARNLLGLAYFKLGLLEAAKSIYDGLLLDYPDEAPLYVNLGLVLLRQGRLDEAEHALDRALRLSPDHARAHCYLGLVLYRRGDLARAREHFLLGDSREFAAKVEKRLAREGGEKPSHAELIRRVADDGVAGLARPDAFRSLDAVRDERVVRDESGWQTAVSHSQPPTDGAGSARRLDEDPSSLLPWPASNPSQLPHPLPAGDEPMQAEGEVLPVAQPRQVATGTTDLPEAMVFGDHPQAPSRSEVPASRLPEISSGREALGFTAGPGSRARLEVNRAAYLRPSTIVAASGRLSMSEAERHFNHKSTGGVFGDPSDPMNRIQGKAILLLRVSNVAVALRGTKDLHVVQRALVGFDDGFEWDNSRILGLDVVTLRGIGSLLLDLLGQPMLMPVDEESPVHSAVGALIAWSDGVRPSPVESRSDRPQLFKLHGRGFVLVQLPPDDDGSFVDTGG